MRAYLIELYLSWFNEDLTMESLAARHSLTVEQTRGLVDLGRMLYGTTIK